MCQAKFKKYIEKAKALVANKKELKDWVTKLSDNIQAIDTKIKEYHFVTENVKVCMESLILPEIARRKEFEELNKKFISLYWSWNKNEQEIKEKFMEKGDLDKLPYAIQKILCGFVHDKDFKVDQEYYNGVSSRDLDSLKRTMEEFFEKWSKNSDHGLKGKLQEYLNQNDDIKDRLAEQTEENIRLVQQMQLFKDEVSKNQSLVANLHAEKQSFDRDT